MATKTSLSQLYVSLLNACRGLPRDPLRPTLQLPDTLEHLVKRTFQIESAATAGTKCESNASIMLSFRDLKTDEWRMLCANHVAASRPSLPSETPESLPLSKSKDEFMTTAQRETLEASLRAIESIGRGKAMSKVSPAKRSTCQPSEQSTATS